MYEKKPTLLFDVEGVLIKNHDTKEDMFTSLVVDRTDFNRVWPQEIYRHGTGETSQDEFIATLAKRLDRPVTSDLSKSLWYPYAQNLEVHHDVMQKIHALGSFGVRLGILSNTIPSHADVLRESGIYEPFGEEAVVLSYETGYRKPDKKAFQIAVGQLDTDPHEIIYFDDNIANVAAARRLDMSAMHVSDISSLSARLFDLYRSIAVKESGHF